jgi:hypothetical protein
MPVRRRMVTQKRPPGDKSGGRFGGLGINGALFAPLNVSQQVAWPQRALLTFWRSASSPTAPTTTSSPIT